jgi:hypothetical protein
MCFPSSPADDRYLIITNEIAKGPDLLQKGGDCSWGSSVKQKGRQKAPTHVVG